MRLGAVQKEELSNSISSKFCSASTIVANSIPTDKNSNYKKYHTTHFETIKQRNLTTKCLLVYDFTCTIIIRKGLVLFRQRGKEKFPIETKQCKTAEKVCTMPNTLEWTSVRKLDSAPESSLLYNMFLLSLCAPFTLGETWMELRKTRTRQNKTKHYRCKFNKPHLEKARCKLLSSWKSSRIVLQVHMFGDRCFTSK